MAVYSSAVRGRGPRHRRGESRRTGQWKLAYADFLTALMAFFLLLWLMTGSSSSEREAIAAYFTGRKVQNAPQIETALSATLDAAHLETIKVLDEALSDLAGLGLSKDQIRTQILDDSLRIELTDSTAAPLFEIGNAALNDKGRTAISAIAEIVLPLDLTFEIEGHTDAYQLPNFGNWKLSNARAHSAWSAFVDAGLSPQKFTAITGRGDSTPLLPGQPHAPANRRITLIVRPNAANRLN